MPIAKKNDESKSEFISRCISHEMKKGRDQEQAAAICYSLYEADQKLKMKLIKIREYRCK